eukprot:CAMPEP_0117613668 /NCGR_PEP_ID=MMETSP0784-20121206/83595_1 /TAXON_ID=39447 /ORGANISM="" /LENGTH=52 /DNA_ID=CAMNT_0005417285 /DNA_START=37 /DNA_END=192 /DNA_ORIENTATION=+
MASHSRPSQTASHMRLHADAVQAPPLAEIDDVKRRAAGRRIPASEIEPLGAT